MHKHPYFIKSVVIMYTTLFLILCYPLSANPSEKVSFNFVDVEIAAITKFVSDITGKNFIFDERVKGKITIVAPTKLDVNDAYKLFTSILELKGYTVIRSARSTYKIIPSIEARQKGIELSSTSQKIVNETYIARLIQLKHLSSGEALKFLRPIISRDGYISEFSPRNLLLVIDSGANIKKILTFISRIDLPSKVEYPEIVYLQNSSAETVAKILNKGLKKKSIRKHESGVAAIKSAEAIADTRLNALVLLGPKSERGGMKELIRMLDAPSPEAQGRINVYFLENADAEELAKVLNAIVGKSSRKSPTAGKNKPLPLPFEISGDILITPDSATNSLVIIASPSDYKNLVAVIKKLDQRRKQVYVEAMILEVSLDDLWQAGIKWRTMAKNNNDPLLIGGVGRLDPTAMESIIYGLSGFTTGGLSNFFNIPYTTIASDGSAKTSTLSVPQYSLIFSLEEFKDAINVLSTPQILTSDNNEAEIIVGQNVPFISKRESDPTRTQSVFSTIERKDVGITLRITPQITEGSFVKLEIYQEISALIPESDSNILISVGPSTTNRSTKTTVMVKDNQTVVIGGLLEEREENTVSKVPVLGDIPLLGLLFQDKRNIKTKINLFVFLTPHIIKYEEMMKELTERKREIIERYRRSEDEKGKEDELLVRFNDETDKHAIDEIFNDLDIKILKNFKELNLWLIKVKNMENLPRIIEQLESTEHVKYVERNYISKAIGDLE